MNYTLRTLHAQFNRSSILTVDTYVLWKGKQRRKFC